MCFLLFDLLRIKIPFSFQVNFPLCLQFPISTKPWFRHTWLELTSLESSCVFSSPSCFLPGGWERSFPHVCGFFPTRAPRGFEHAAVVGCWLQLPVPPRFFRDEDAASQPSHHWEQPPLKHQSSTCLTRVRHLGTCGTQSRVELM